MRRLVNIGTKRLEVSIVGDGMPVVILPGLASFIDEWELVINKLSTHAQVITFHRSGYGNSDLGLEKRNTLATAKALHLLLKELDINCPVTLAGHSYGGFCAQRFALEYPKKVHSMLLIESSSMDFELLNEYLGPQTAQWSSMYRSLAKMDEEEIKNTAHSQLLPQHQKLSKEAKERILKFKVSPVMYQSMADEMDEMPKCAETLKKSRKLLNIPLTVIGRDPECSIQMMINQGMPKSQAENVENIWQNLIKGQLEISTNSSYIMAENSGHGVYVDNPNAIVKAVISLISETN